MTTQSEQALENGLLQTLLSTGYEQVTLKEEENLFANFKRQLEKHNRKALAEAGRTELTGKEFDRVKIHLEGGTRFEKAKKLRDLYPLELEDGQRVYIEFLNKRRWCQNEFQVSNQITIEGRKKCRYDVTILINGLPLVQIELKRRGMELKEAYNQIERYHKTSFSGLFDYVQLFVISNGVNTRYFANNPNGGYRFTFNWTDVNNVPYNELEGFARTFLEKCSLGKMISKYIVLHEGTRTLMALRPYQYYAVEKILDRIENTVKNGYIWHTTGAGKTLTSFKAAQLASELDGVEKVLFIVDRRDLDTQTKEEYNSFEPGAVDNTDNTFELVRRLSSDSPIIITTIQKLNAAITRDGYSRQLQAVMNRKMVLIFDECHRSQFGESHRNIRRFFPNIRLFGFTGTPIFTENAAQRTTAEVFGECLHRYLIKDAIADQNVLSFLVEYYKGKEEQPADLLHHKRMEEIAKFILENFSKSTYGGECNALFATPSVPALLDYYKIFKSLNPKIKVGAVFTYAANPSQDDDNTGTGQGHVSQRVMADELQMVMDDYNEMFGTQFSTDNFAAYCDDVNKRMKKTKPDMEALDLLLVVNMFLTGFDAKKLNTLYVDKNLEYHGLVQAFSRTNRVLNDKKPFGKIVCFRNLKPQVDAAIKLFSNSENDVDIIRKPFAEVKQDFNELAARFKEKYPYVQSVDMLQSEYDKRDFVLAFREIIKLRTEMQVYEDYDKHDETLLLTEQEFWDFRSKYLDIAIGPIHPPSSVSEPPSGYGSNPLDDIDFCLELLHSDVINVAYILMLILDLNTKKKDFDEQRQHILNVVSNDALLRPKERLVDEFMRQIVDNDKAAFERAKAAGTLNLEDRLLAFTAQKRKEAVEDLAAEEEIDVTALHRFLQEYDYLNREKPEIIQEAVKKKKAGLLERRSILDRVTRKLRDIIDKFSWK